MNRRKNRTGFTLIEVLMAVSISIMVFAAMGLLLTKCFSLWKDATAHWRLTQYARISRERILSGFTNYVSEQTGLLSASEMSITEDSGWAVIEYGRMTEPGVVYQIRGWPDESSDKHIEMRRASAHWVYGLGTGTNEPAINVDSFSASASNHLVEITYRLRFSAAGKTFYQWQTITTALLNEE